MAGPLIGRVIILTESSSNEGEAKQEEDEEEEKANFDAAIDIFFSSISPFTLLKICEILSIE